MDVELAAIKSSLIEMEQEFRLDGLGSQQWVSRVFHTVETMKVPWPSSLRFNTNVQTSQCLSNDRTFVPYRILFAHARAFAIQFFRTFVSLHDRRTENATLTFYWPLLYIVLAMWDLVGHLRVLVKHKCLPFSACISLLHGAQLKDCQNVQKQD